MSTKEKINIVASERDLSYCYLKTAEELFELGEILLKQVTKPHRIALRNYSNTLRLIKTINKFVIGIDTSNIPEKL